MDSFQLATTVTADDLLAVDKARNKNSNIIDIEFVSNARCPHCVADKFSDSSSGDMYKYKSTSLTDDVPTDYTQSVCCAVDNHPLPKFHIYICGGK